jgi:hypothetical protein
MPIKSRLTIDFGHVVDAVSPKPKVTLRVAAQEASSSRAQVAALLKLRRTSAIPSARRPATSTVPGVAPRRSNHWV